MFHFVLFFFLSLSLSLPLPLVPSSYRLVFRLLAKKRRSTFYVPQLNHNTCNTDNQLLVITPPSFLKIVTCLHSSIFLPLDNRVHSCITKNFPWDSYCSLNCSCMLVELISVHTSRLHSSQRPPPVSCVCSCKHSNRPACIVLFFLFLYVHKHPTLP